MSDLKKRFKEILDDLEKNIQNKEDLEYIKSQVYNIFLLFLDELDKLSEMNLDRINVMLEREKELGNKIAKMEKVINNIEKEVFVPQECDFEIICPYCNTEFVEDLSNGTDKEVKCPECGNVIELDWHDDEDSCTHNCESGACSCDDCDECDECIEDDEENEEEDEDM